MDKDFKYNHERYYDPTAYKALNNVQKGEKMIDTRLKIQNRIGEIWTIRCKANEYKALVIADNGQVVTFIKLVDEKTNNCDFDIICQGKMYGSSRMIQHTFTQFCETFHRIATDDEFKEIMDKVSKSLGIESKVIEKVVEKEVVNDDVKVFGNVAEHLELERTKAQLEVYKGLYENLMKQMVG